MIRVTTAMIARYMPELMNGSEDSGSVPSACTQLAAQKCLKDNDLNKDQILTGRGRISRRPSTYDANQDGKLEHPTNSRTWPPPARICLSSYIAPAARRALAKTAYGHSVGESAQQWTGLRQAGGQEVRQDNDADKDGKLSAAETGFEAEDFAKLDTNEARHRPGRDDRLPKPTRASCGPISAARVHQRPVSSIVKKV
jgi:hypothetical protein